MTAFTERDHYAHAWGLLRRSFPDAWACVLMPDHIHLLLPPTARAARVKRRFVRVTTAISQARGVRLWEPIPPPSVISSREKLLRDFRYILLNPNRDRLVRDPLQWEWSTLRDFSGAVMDPWVGADRVIKALKWTGKDPKASLYRYRAEDDSVTARPSLFPRTPKAGVSIVVSIDRVAMAVASAYRIELEGVYRRGPARSSFVRVLRWLRCFRPAEIRAKLRISSRTFDRLSASGLDETEWQVIRLILADPRLAWRQPEKGELVSMAG